MTLKRRGQARDPIYETIDLIGDAWSWLIIVEAMSDGLTRYGEFRKRLGISRRVLADRLDKLTRGGLFERRAVRSGGSVFEYVLTPMGWDFFGCLAVARGWAERWFDEGGEARSEWIHRDHAFRAVQTCSGCREPIRAREVTVERIHRASADLISAQRQRTPELDLIDPTNTNPVATTLKFIGDRWSSLVIRECFLGTRRFGQFADHLGIAPNILTSRLERLEKLGALVKIPYQPNPPRYDYRLTEMGLDLYGVPLAMWTWGERWLFHGRRGMGLRHEPCGQPLMAVLTCEVCGEPVSYADVCTIGSSTLATAGRES